MKLMIPLAALMFFTSISCWALELENERGGKVTIESSEDTLVCAMATWCPYSRALAESFNTPEFKAATSHLKIIYVYSDEWPTVKAMLEGQAGAEEGARQYEELKSQAGGSIVFDAAHLEEIEVPVYFIPKDSEVEPDGFPSAFDFESNSYSANPFIWLIEIAGIDKDLVSRVHEQGLQSQGIE